MDYLYIVYEGYNYNHNDGGGDLRKPHYLKIGVTGNPIERLKQLQTSNPRPLALWDIRPIKSTENRERFETEIHKLFEKHRVSGEWFVWHDDIMDWAYYSILNCYSVEEVMKMSSEDYFYKLGLLTAKRDTNASIKELLNMYIEQHLGGIPQKSYGINNEGKVAPW